MYITTYKTNVPRIQYISYNNIMSQEQFQIPETISYYKVTAKIEQPTPFEQLPHNMLEQIADTTIALQQAERILRPFAENYEEQYYEFQIPKRSGGLRTINAPNTEFKQALTEVKDLFENKIKCLPHNCAYAYIKQRSTIDALKKHQQNNSNWYLKLDLQDFFPNCTPEIIYDRLIQLFPFYYLENESRNKLKQIIKICCLHNGLPQGTPMSPLLTNLVMVSYDYEIYQKLVRRNGQHFVYTRYADDILISSQTHFDWQALQTELAEILQPFQIKTQKTRYGSKAGQNWNLGLMLNKDNKITIGHKKVKLLNAMLNNFLKDFSNGIRWSLEDAYTLQGQLSYWQHINPEYFEYILYKYETKYNLDYRQTMKRTINNN